MGVNAVTVNGEPFEAGCYVGGHMGQYGADEVCRLADLILDRRDFSNLACVLRHDAEAAAERGAYYRACELWERHMECCDAAEEALNEATVDGFWTWEDGEFFLVSLEDMVDEVEGWVF